MKYAIIDLGTNTFHLMIVENQKVLFKTSKAAKIGMGGINAGVITEEGIQRALGVLGEFKSKITEFEVAPENVHAFGTSAVRNAGNQAEFLERVKAETGIVINVIDGKEEAELIYQGVKQAVTIEHPSLIVDIGGGSVEFIICNAEKVLWLQSFEIGGQRLLERFMKKDPIPASEINRLEEYLRETLLPLTNAVHQYSPKILIGSSGSFDTLNDMFFWRNRGDFAPHEIHGFEYPIEEFAHAYELIVFANHEERAKIGGMIPLRVDMMVVATILIKFLLQTYHIAQIKISNFALKEGVMAKIENA
jgi:exopolyphosphatase/guanosine-5'-triphosphate,3'-diphosphate pyrophosphatase